MKKMTTVTIMSRSFRRYLSRVPLLRGVTLPAPPASFSAISAGAEVMSVASSFTASFTVPW